MKRILALILAVFIAAPLPLLLAAADGWTQGPTHLWRFQSDQTWDAKTSIITASPVQAFFCYELSNGTQTVQNQVGSVTFDPVAIGMQQTVTVGKVTVDYGTLAALNAQAALDQWNKQQAALAKPIPQ